MIKKVNIEQLRPGIYIHDFGTKWSEHPFFTNKRKIASSWDVDRIREYNITEVYIDTTRGLNVLPVPVPINEWTKAFENKKAEDKLMVKKLPWSPLEEELLRAKEIQDSTYAYIQQQAENMKAGIASDYGQATKIAEKINESLVRNHNALLALISVPNNIDYTIAHAFKVSVLMAFFCKKLGFELEQVKLFAAGGLLYDLGMFHIDDAIRLKKGLFEITDKNHLREHPERAGDILKQIKDLDPEIVNMACEHHERLDGSGYPHKLTDEEISIGGRLTAIADVYSAMTSDRLHRKGKAAHEVMKYLFKEAAEKFDQELLKTFFHTTGIYPVGSLVMLRSGFLAVVIGTPTENIQRPKVMIFYDTKKNRAIAPRKLDLNSGVNELHQIAHVESAEKWNVDFLKLLAVSKN